MAFGDYKGGNLTIHEGDLSGSYDICYQPIVYDFSKNLHSVEAFTGARYSLVYYTFALKKQIPDLPPPSVQEEDGVYVFYRGTERISAKEGLPHVKKGRTKD